MNKQELIAKISDRTGLMKKDTEDVVVAFMDIVKESLIAGDKVSISGFGSFEVVERAERIGRNPKTGENIMIAASKSPKFKPAKALKEIVNV